MIIKNIIYFDLITVKEGKKEVDKINYCTKDSDKEFTRFKEFDEPNNLIVGWDIPVKEVREVFKQAKYLDLSKAYSKIILGSKTDVRSLKELKIRHEIKNIETAKALQVIDNEHNITDKILAMIETTGINDPNCLFGVTAPLESYIAKNNISISSNNDNTNKGYNLGGLNIIGENKRYENLKHFDVKSMYPSILISLQASSNLDYPNLKCSVVDDMDKDKWERVSKNGTLLYVQNEGLKQAKIRVSGKNI